MEHPRPSPFGRTVDAARGTVVFGNGVTALVGEIAHTGNDDYLIVTGHPSGDFSGPAHTYAVPLSSVVYVRFADEQ